jgi:galactokinase
VSPHEPAAPTFADPPEVTADAPGRVNLIGEHTDYNDGLVLPMPIPQRTRVALKKRGDDLVRVASEHGALPPGERMVEYRLGEERAGGGFGDYVQGCTRVLAEARHRIGGFAATIRSAVPIGAGLASSAALEVSLLRALRAAFALPLDDVELALLAHRAEHDFVGARVGIMDQMAASLGEPGTALFLDTQSMSWERVPLPQDLEIAVIDSGVAHRHAAGEYNTRRRECERAAELLGIASLRALDIGDLPRAAELPDPLGKRVQHVVTENARVRAAVVALRNGEVAVFGLLLDASHASLREDYQVSVPDVDRLVALAQADRDVLGARMTGGGFGGAIVVAARRGTAAAAAERIARAYREGGGAPSVLLPEPAP